MAEDSSVGETTRVRLVYTVSHGCEHFYCVLQASLLLSRETEVDVHVVWLPFETLKDRVERAFRSLGRPAPGEARRSGEQGSGLYERFARGGQVALTRCGRRITFVHARVGTISRIRCSLSALGGALRAVLASVRGLRFAPQQFLRTTYKRTRIGDLAASSYLRSPRSGDSVEAGPRLFRIVWKSCYLIDLAELVLSGTQPGGAYTITPEVNYIHAAPHRYLHARGAAALENGLPGAALVIVPPGKEYDGRAHAWNSARRSPESAPLGSSADIDSYFATRLSDPSNSRSHAHCGQNVNDDDRLRDEGDAAVSLDAGRVYAVVFLHLLADVEFYFGLDGFDGLAHWTFHSIDACLCNLDIAGVLIKPHPSLASLGTPVDRRLLAKITRRYAANGRATVLHPRASLRRMCDGGQIVGITHHGSVAEEIVYLGQPVIASTFAPWADRYRFARLWSTPAAYNQLLRAISYSAWTPPTAIEHAELARYLRDHRLAEIRIEDKDPGWMLAKVARANGRERDALTFSPEQWRRTARSLEQLRENDPEFAALLCEFEKLEVSRAVS